MSGNVRILYQSYGREEFLKSYTDMLSLCLTTKNLNGLINLPESINDLPEGLVEEMAKDGYIVVKEGSYYTTIPIITPQLSKDIAQYLSSDIKAIALEVANLLSNSVEMNYRHILLGNITLGFLWQSILNRMQAEMTSGSIVILTDPEKSATLYIDGIGNGTGAFITWAQTSLQRNNQFLNAVFNHKDVKSMLFSINEEGVMTPIGEAAERLRTIKVAKLIRGKLEHISSNHLVDPQITPQVINKLRPILCKLTKAGVNAIKHVALMSDKAYNKFVSDANVVNKDYFTQAVYFIVCHELMNQWRELKVIPEWRKVPLV